MKEIKNIFKYKVIYFLIFNTSRYLFINNREEFIILILLFKESKSYYYYVLFIISSLYPNFTFLVQAESQPTNYLYLCVFSYLWVF